MLATIYTQSSVCFFTHILAVIPLYLYTCHITVLQLKGSSAEHFEGLDMTQHKGSILTRFNSTSVWSILDMKFTPIECEQKLKEDITNEVNNNQQ